MKKRLQLSKGSALIVVVFLVGIMALLTGSMLRYSVSERTSNERTRLSLRARNMAENLALYAAEQLTTKLRRLRSSTPMEFVGGSNRIHLPPDSVLETNYSTVDDVEIHAGLTSSTPLTFIDPNNSANASNPNVGLQVSTSTVPIIAKATMRHSSIGELTAYAQQDLEISMIPLFQFAVFYNMDMEFGPGPNMTISGPVHTNGNLIARIQTGFGNTLRFTDRVTAAGGFFANTAHKGPTYMGNGSVDNGPGGDGPLYFQNLAGTATNIRNGSTWRDHKYGNSSVSATSLANFKAFATSAYAGNLRTSVHGVTTLDLPSIGGYKETDDPTTPEDDRKNGRQLIEPPSATDSADLKGTKIARKAGLYIIVNPDDETRTGILPNATAVAMRPRSYRCWLNTVNNDLSHTMFEVILPGQPSYGDLNANLNNLPNAFRKNTSIGHNQVLRIPKGGGVDASDTGYAAGDPTMATFQDAYFWDMRRATNSTGYPFIRTTAPFTPRRIAKIDLDLTRLKMAIERTLNDATTSTIYDPNYPDASNWAASIYNASAAAASYGLGIGSSYNSFPTSEGVVAVEKTQAAVFIPGSITVNAWTQTGTAAPSAYTGRFVVSRHDGTSWTDLPATGDVTFVTETPPAGTTQIRVRLYAAGGTTTLLDDQIIPVVADDGTNTVVAVLDNDRYIVPGNSLTTSFEWADAVFDMHVFVGGVDDTANWSFSAATQSGTVVGRLGGDSTSGSTSTGTGNQANRYTATGMDAGAGVTTGVVRITASKTGYASVTKDITFVKQHSVVGMTGTNDVGRWLSATTARHVDPYRIYFAPANPADPLIANDPSTFEVTPLHLINTSVPSPWFDGVTVYVHSVDAESKTRADAHVIDDTHDPDRIDSGVRLWNGRGSLVSLDGGTYPGRTGFSFATNDATYIVGHFNADGSIDSSTTDTGTGSPNYYGGYSGRYPEGASEMLTSVMGDAITILSQPLFSASYYQTSGWADSLSAHRRTPTSTGYSTNWATTNPSGSNTQDGRNTAVRPARLPNLSDRAFNIGLAGAADQSAKFDPSITEVSTCLLTGIVPTSTQTSGGVHNFPRLQEDWGGSVALYIRGSMVAMFQSQVATEPWSIRYYQGAIRNWGLHQKLRDAGHDLPLEPIVLSAQRMRYRELTAAEYNAQKAVINALPGEPDPETE